MPCFNAKRTISCAIGSVLDQTYSNWELLVIDDGSVDSSSEIVSDFSTEDSRIKLIRMSKNGGPALARNKGIESASGKFIAFLDSDDIWFPQKLEKQVKFAKENNASLVYSSYLTMNESGEDVGCFKIPKEKIMYRDLLKTCVIGNLTALYNTEALGKVFMEDVGHEDYTLWLKILKKTPYAYGLLEPLAKYRVSSHSISSNKLRSARWQWIIYRNVEKLSFWESCYFFSIYSYYGVFKY